MTYKPIFIKEDIKLRPRQIPQPDDFNETANALIRQSNSVSEEVGNIGTSISSIDDSFEDLKVLTQRKIDTVIAGVMPDGSISYSKLHEALKIELSESDVTATGIATARNTIGTDRSQFIQKRNSNRVDITELKKGMI